MHILQVTPRYFPNIGGVEIVVQTISELLSKRGISVTVYSVDFNPRLPRQQKVNGVLVKRFVPLLGDPFYIPAPDFIGSIRKENVDVVHIHNIHTLLPCVTALLTHKSQKLLLQPHYHRFGQTSMRDFFFNLYKKAWHKLFFSYVDCVIVNSDYEKKIFLEDFAKCRNVLLIPEGITINELKLVDWKPEKPARILYIGGLRRYKNVDKLIEAFEQLVRKMKIDSKLVIIGKGEEYPRLVELAKKLKLMEFIEWKHSLSREQLLSEYSKASVFVLLSPLESFSRVVYEALLIGVPTVVLNFGATSTLIKNGLAVGVNSLNPEEIAQGILDAIKKSSIKIKKPLSFFLSWENYINRLLEVYRRML
jgi:glycosyltransferase involved in cell wall biosynthesis